MYLKNKISIFFLLPAILLGMSRPVKAGNSSILNDNENKQRLNYPVPPKSKRLLFYVQRSKNTNAIVYETNLLPDGKINTEDPVHVYWIRYSSDSTLAELNFIQRNYAYGLKSKLQEGKSDQFILNFVSYEKRKLHLLPSKDGSTFHALTLINGKMAILDKVFISLNGGTFWFPVIEDIEMQGRDPLTQEVVTEHFKP
jgi:hypothetical protein